MSINHQQQFVNSNNQLLNNLNQSYSECAAQINGIIQKLEVIDFFGEKVNTECASVLKEVSYDVFSSCYFALCGLYRNSFMSLRSGLELNAAFFFFTEHNFYFKLWQKNEYDVKWSVLSNGETGVISKKYISNILGLDETEAEKMINDYSDLYRISSEYLHGKYSFMHTLNGSVIRFDKATLNAWIGLADKILNLIISLLILKYNSLIPAAEYLVYQTIEEIGLEYKTKSYIPAYGK